MTAPVRMRATLARAETSDLDERKVTALHAASMFSLGGPHTPHLLLKSTMKPWPSHQLNASRADGSPNPLMASFAWTRYQLCASPRRRDGPTRQWRWSADFQHFVKRRRRFNASCKLRLARERERMSHGMLRDAESATWLDNQRRIVAPNV
jgi:hypothetical protein